MKKLNIKKAFKKNFRKEVITLFVYLLFFPLLGYISYSLYMNFIMIENLTSIFRLVILALIVGINIVALYGVNYIIKIVPKKFFIYNGIVLNFILILMSIYYVLIKESRCQFSDYACDEFIQNEGTLRIVLILGITYTLIYLIMYSITNKDKKRHLIKNED